MANPKNIVSLTGSITGRIRMLSRSDGETFGCLFNLSVKRNYRNHEGVYEDDILPIKYIFPSDSVMSFIKTLSEGDVIQLSGTVRIGTYGKEKGQIHILAESISLDDQDVKRRKNTTSGTVSIAY